MYLVRSAWFSQRDSGYFPLRCSVKIIRSTGGTLTGIQKTHTWSTKKQWKCHKKTCKGSPTPKLGGEMSSSRVASIRYHSNYPCALPCNVSFTRHTTSFLRWISHLWMAIHFMTRQPSEVIPWKGRLKNIYIKTGKNNPFPIESITQQGSSPPCCNYTILPNMSKLDPKNSLLPTCSPSSCRESGGSKWNKHTFQILQVLICIHVEIFDVARDYWLISTQWNTTANQPLARKFHANAVRAYMQIVKYGMGFQTSRENPWYNFVQVGLSTEEPPWTLFKLIW